MNTCSSNIPYLLTANHCLDAGNVPNWVFQFQTWSTTCVGNVGWREDIQFNGCQLRANDAITDFALLQMNTTPAANSGIHYAGWSRQTTGITSTTVIHHPEGDLMKIARDNNAPAGVTFLGVDCWQLDLDLGRVERGSSGGPYFNQNHQIIGQHWRRPEAGTRPICDITVTLGGRFDRSWTGGGTNATRLSNWLDPNNSGAITTNTANVSALFPLNPTLTITGSPTTDYICSGSSTYTLNGLPGNATVSWSVFSPYVVSIPNPSTGSSVVLTKQVDGIVTLTANVTLCGGESRTVNKTIMIGAAIDGYYRIASDYHNYGIFNPLYNNNSPIWLPANKLFGVDVFLTSPGLQSATWTRAATSYPFTWNTSGTFLSFSGTSGASAYVERKGIFNISAQTSCGTFNGVYNWPVIVQGWGSFKITTSPNPANDLITVNISEESPDVKALSNGENVTIEMYSFNQTILIKTWRFKNDHNQFSLNVADVNKGQYILVVRKGKFKESKQILIE